MEQHQGEQQQHAGAEVFPAGAGPSLPPHQQHAAAPTEATGAGGSAVEARPTAGVEKPFPVIRLRGLMYDVTEAEINHFLVSVSRLGLGPGPLG